MEYPENDILLAILQDQNASREENGTNEHYPPLIKFLTGESLHSIYAQWPEEKRHEMFSCVVAAKFHNQPHIFSNYLAYNLPSGMNFPELTRYMLTITSSLLGDRYQFDEATASVRWIYQSALRDEVNLDDAKRFVREFGKLGDLRSLDTYCRRMLDDATPGDWEFEFCDLLAEGMLSRLGEQWPIWDLISWVVLNQTNPIDHYSRKGVLIHQLISLLKLGITFYANERMREILDELSKLCKPKEFEKLKKRLGIPEPEE